MRLQSGLYLVAAAAMLLSGLVVGGTRASFTDTAAASSTFTSGSVDLSLVSGAGAVNCSTASGYADTIAGVISSTGNTAGAITTGAVCIKNQGTLTSQWALSSAISDDASGALKAVTKIRLWSLNSTGSSSATSCTDGFTSAGADVTLTGGGQTNFGAEVYPSALLSTNPSIAVGASTQLSTGGYMKLCVSVVLPSSVTDTSLSSKTITLNFTLTGNQV